MEFNRSQIHLNKLIRILEALAIKITNKLSIFKALKHKEEKNEYSILDYYFDF